MNIDKLYRLTTPQRDILLTEQYYKSTSVNNVVGRNRFLMNPTKWKKEFNSIGIVPSAGKYSKGTYAHPDIAFEYNHI